MNAEQAHLLLHRSLSETLGEEEWAQLQAWESEHPDNAAEAQLLREIWEQAQPRTFPESIDLSTDFARVQEKLTRRSSEPKAGKAVATVRRLEPRRSARRRVVWRYVAAAAAIAIIAWVVWPTMDRDAPVQLLVEEDTRVELPDGSVVHLRSGSSLSYPSAFAKTSRLVELRGEAVFEVEKDSERPFNVSSGLLEVEVLGTIFNVRSGNTPSVSVQEGRVRVAYANSEKVLSAGQSAYVTAGGQLSRRADTNLNAFAWQRGYFTFNGESLQDVVQLLRQQGGYAVTTDSTGVVDCPVLGRYPVDLSPERLASVLAAPFGMKVRQSGSGYVLSGGSCAD